MPRVDYREMLMDENFYPCNQCGDTEFYLDFDIYKCVGCGEEMKIRKISKTLNLERKKKLRKFREE